MKDYNDLTLDEIYQLIALQNKGVIRFIYDKYAAALYGEILKKVNDHNDADDILFRTFIMFVKTQPNPLQPLPRVFIRLHTIAVNVLNKTGILYPIRTEKNIQFYQRYS